MKYDDATWHSGGDYPANLPAAAAATHTGMYLAWALLVGLGGRFHGENSAYDLEALKARTITPGAFLLTTCDGKFLDEDLSEEGNAFTQIYFDFETGQYLKDYQTTLDHQFTSIYLVADSWENFDLLKPILDARLNAWRKDRPANPA